VGVHAQAMTMARQTPPSLVRRVLDKRDHADDDDAVRPSLT
jgi:hypothetical protein